MLLQQKLLALTLPLTSGLLWQCARTEENKAKSGSGLDPNQATITAYVFHLQPTDQGKPKVSASWKNGAGEVLLGDNFTATRLRQSFQPTLRSQDLEFEITVNGVKASSGGLNFKDCNFISELGYQPTDFQHMLVNFDFSAGTLVRTTPGSSGQDLTAVICERILPASELATVSLLMAAKRDSEPITIESNGIVITPKRLSRENARDDQQVFQFALAPSNKLEIRVLSKSGSKTYQLSFQRCLNLISDKSPLSQEHSLFFDESGNLQEGGDLSCCYSDGSCSELIVN